MQGQAAVDAILTKRIKKIYSVSKETYGSARIYAELIDEGLSVDRKLVERLMKAAGLQGVSRRKFITTTVRDKRARRHSALGQQSPITFERRANATLESASP